jgi:hypothetical protein
MDLTLEKTYSCEYCPKKFKTKSYIAKHVRIEHNNSRPFECLICDSKFGILGRLKRHVDLVHENKKVKLKTKTITEGAAYWDHGSWYHSVNGIKFTQIYKHSDPIKRRPLIINQLGKV